MAHISSIGAGMFSDLSISYATYNFPTSNPSTLDQAGFDALFATEIEVTEATPTDTDFIRIENVREFPSMGTPPNIVNVPVYGQATSQQVQGQADAPSIEVTLNFIGTDWDDTDILGNRMLATGDQFVFRFTLLNTEPTGSSDTKWASSAAGIGSVQNTYYYWIGKMEALQVNPQLTDANTATLTISVQSDFYGAYTEN